MDYSAMTPEELLAEANRLQAERDAVKDKLKALWEAYDQKFAEAKIESLGTSLPDGYVIVKADKLSTSAKANEV